MCSDTAVFSLHLYSLLKKVSFEEIPTSRCRDRELEHGGWGTTKCPCEEGEPVSALLSSAEGVTQPAMGGADLYIIGWEGHGAPSLPPREGLPGVSRSSPRLCFPLPQLPSRSASRS